MVTIDILYLVDRLEALLNKGQVVPFTTKRLIDEDEFLDIVDQMRIAIPEEIKQARKVAQDKERILAQAQEEAARTVELAKEQAARLAEAHEVARLAQERARMVHGQAESEALSTREGADQYASEVLTDLQSRLDELAARLATLQATVYNGLRFIKDKRQVETPPPPPPPARPNPPS
jgi:hypothetical protein